MILFPRLALLVFRGCEFLVVRLNNATYSADLTSDFVVRLKSSEIFSGTKNVGRIFDRIARKPLSKLENCEFIV